MPKTLVQRFFQKSRSATLSVSPISGHGTRRHESSSRHSTILACKKAEIKRKTDLSFANGGDRKRIQDDRESEEGRTEGVGKCSRPYG
jgi:hypothetical protein